MRIFDLAAQIILASSLLLASCASYAPEPLAGAPDLRSGVSGLVAPSDRFPLPERRTHRYGLNRPLGIDEIDLIAAVNNPDLKAARSRIGVAHAQAFAAGILPNPQASADYGFLLGGPGTMNS